MSEKGKFILSGIIGIALAVILVLFLIKMPEPAVDHLYNDLNKFVNGPTLKIFGIVAVTGIGLWISFGRSRG